MRQQMPAPLYQPDGGGTPASAGMSAGAPAGRSKPPMLVQSTSKRRRHTDSRNPRKRTRYLSASIAVMHAAHRPVLRPKPEARAS
jgi:hypothetical protein